MRKSPLFKYYTSIIIDTIMTTSLEDTKSHYLIQVSAIELQKQNDGDSNIKYILPSETDKKFKQIYYDVVSCDSNISDNKISIANAYGLYMTKSAILDSNISKEIENDSNLQDSFRTQLFPNNAQIDSNDIYFTDYNNSKYFNNSNIYKTDMIQTFITKINAN